MSPFGLYIHIPFCLKKCNYCAFYSTPTLDLIEAFVDALVGEMTSYRGFGAFDSIYFGGGTPSLLTIPQLEKITNAIHRIFEIQENAEWTIEGNPGDLNGSYSRQLRGLGFNRINIGVQSTNDHVLSFLGRRHTREDAMNAIRNARASGLKNVGLDFIYGIPGQNISDCLSGLADVISFSPEHISCYQLTIEDSTPLGELYRRGLITKLDEDIELDFFLKVSETLTGAGYIHYEVSNFAKSPSSRSRHNMKYWDHTPYLGLGPASHSFKDRRRWWNVRSLGDYCEKTNAGESPIESEERLTEEDFLLETLCLGLRTIDGISIVSLRDCGGGVLSNKSLVDHLQSEDLIQIMHGRIRPTLKGMALADALAVELSRR